MLCFWCCATGEDMAVLGKPDDGDDDDCIGVNDGMSLGFGNKVYNDDRNFL